MSADDLLWKQVDEMKTKRPKANQKTASRRKSSRKPSQRPEPVASSPSNANATSKTRTEPERTANAGDAYGRTDARTSANEDHLLRQVPPRPINRMPERYAFNFWADQITRLKKLKQVLNVAKDADDRSEITLSDLVREAIDDYLDRQTGGVNRTDSTA